MSQTFLWKKSLMAQLNCFSSGVMRFWLIASTKTEEYWTWLKTKEFKLHFLCTVGIIFLSAFMHLMPWAIFDKRIFTCFWYLRSFFNLNTEAFDFRPLFYKLSPTFNVVSSWGLELQKWKTLFFPDCSWGDLI